MKKVFKIYGIKIKLLEIIATIIFINIHYKNNY